jgi:flagellar biosynthesis protein FlhB
MADSNKTEQATPQKQRKAREKGQVARSREFSSTLAGIAAVSVFFWQAPAGVQQWRQLFQSCLDLAAARATVSPKTMVFWCGWTVLRWTLPPMLCAFGLSLLSSVAQGGFLIAPEALKPDISKMSPASKLKQLFSLTGLSSLLKSLLPFFVIAYLAYGTVSDNWARIVTASEVSLRTFASLLTSVCFAVGWKSALVLLVWSGVDYLLVWRKLNSDLKMTRQEVRQEMKDDEGDPMIKGRRRRMQRQRRRKETLKAVETATVVVANPTHFAVALRYEVDMDAPVVVAKGRDLLAEEIKNVARWQGIAIVENPPLAHALYRGVEIGQTIPAKLYTAVAEILAMVFRAQAQVRKQNQQRQRATYPWQTNPGY